MVINKGKMEIRLQEDVEKLKREIEELQKVKNILINSSAYKLLYGKTQTVISTTRENVRVRARAEHSQNISKIAQNIICTIYDECATEEQKSTLIFQLNKQKEMLYVEICSLGHDLGHTPYGHDGERSINNFIQQIDDSEQIKRIIDKRIKYFGREYEKNQGHIGENVSLSFEHNEQSALTFCNLINNSDINLDAIDMQRMINAILSHSTTRVKECPKDLVAQVVRITDKIEYRNMDFYELGKYINPEKYSNKKLAEMSAEERIAKMEKELIKEILEKGSLDDNMEALQELRLFRKQYEETIYFLDVGRKGLLTSQNIERDRTIVRKLLEYYYENPDEISYNKYTKSLYPVKPINKTLKGSIYSVQEQFESEELTRIEMVINYILSFDNAMAEKQYLKLVKQRILTGKGIEPVTEKELEAVRMEQEEEKIEQLRGKEFIRTGQAHTVQETRNIIRARYAEFVQESLTDLGKRVIENTKKKIARDSKVDIILSELMERADTDRKYNKKALYDKKVDSIIGLKTLSESKKIERAVENVKERPQEICVEYLSNDAKKMIEERKKSDDWRNKKGKPYYQHYVEDSEYDI